MNARNFDVKVLECHSAGFESYRSKLAHNSTQIKDYPSMLKILLLQQVDQNCFLQW
jgi:hypothetical protein